MSANKFKVIKLSNKLNLDHAEALRKRLLKETAVSMKLKSDKCEMIDLAFIQLLYSLYITAEKENKQLVVEIPFNEEQVELLKNAGIYNMIFSGVNSNILLKAHCNI